ncbi:probable WRKY transcription factor 34 [Asparagus officinalis]|uniref:probable WRKY transcription factor 34 n=1 Tax=Asparagus officinalis TaxID=4686 RepID=UPI00098E5CF9|nr:probable WRKY transcription factor 34 [Asparagus officinalis]XP_020244426.1 probable WRKY transcription factor 34 [Asparagus officinalis]XP_020244428.1 probable WRKY transcription factor 34 [Asparagus officinalis]
MELAAKELTKAQQLMAQLWIVNKDCSESAREFSVGVMRAIEAALILLNSVEKNADSVKEPRKIDPKSDKKAKRLRIEDPNPNEPRKRRGQNLSNVVITSSPFGGGYQWRKYGQKNIQNSKHPRCYYRCTYAPYCEAKKQVRQKNSSYPPDYEVIFINEHSCIAQMDSSLQRSTELESKTINSDLDPNGPNPISKEKENDAESSGSLGTTDEIDWMPPLSPIDLHGIDIFAYDDPLMSCCNF